MSKSTISSAASLILAAAIVLATWLPTLSMPARLGAEQASAPAPTILV